MKTNAKWWRAKAKAKLQDKGRAYFDGIPQNIREELHILRLDILELHGWDVLNKTKSRDATDARRMFLAVLNLRHDLFPVKYDEFVLNSKHVSRYLGRDRSSLYHYINTFYIIEDDKKLNSIFKKIVI